jgi:hypothetical protein
VALWAKTSAGTLDFSLVTRLRTNVLSSSGDLTASTSWQRFIHVVEDVGSGSTQCQMRISTSSGVDTGQLIIWGAQAERSLYISSDIRTSGATGTRAADALYAENSVVDSLFWTEGFEFDFWPEDISGDRGGLGSFFFFQPQGAGTYYLSATSVSTTNHRFRYRAGGVQATIDVAFVTGDKVTIKLKHDDPNGFKIFVNDSLQGVDTTSTYDWTAHANKDLYVGRTLSDTSYINGIMSTIRPLT